MIVAKESKIKNFPKYCIVIHCRKYYYRKQLQLTVYSRLYICFVFNNSKTLWLLLLRTYCLKTALGTFSIWLGGSTVSWCCSTSLGVTC